MPFLLGLAPLLDRCLDSLLADHSVADAASVLFVFGAACLNAVALQLAQLDGDLALGVGHLERFGLELNLRDHLLCGLNRLFALLGCALFSFAALFLSGSGFLDLILVELLPLDVPLCKRHVLFETELALVVAVAQQLHILVKVRLDACLVCVHAGDELFELVVGLLGRAGHGGRSARCRCSRLRHGRVGSRGGLRCAARVEDALGGGVDLSASSLGIRDHHPTNLASLSEVATQDGCCLGRNATDFPSDLHQHVLEVDAKDRHGLKNDGNALLDHLHRAGLLCILGGRPVERIEDGYHVLDRAGCQLHAVVDQASRRLLADSAEEFVPCVGEVADGTVQRLRALRHRASKFVLADGLQVGGDLGRVVSDGLADALERERDLIALLLGSDAKFLEPFEFARCSVGNRLDHLVEALAHRARGVAIAGERSLGCIQAERLHLDESAGDLGQLEWRGRGELLDPRELPCRRRARTCDGDQAGVQNVELALHVDQLPDECRGRQASEQTTQQTLEARNVFFDRPKRALDGAARGIHVLGQPCDVCRHLDR